MGWQRIAFLDMTRVVLTDTLGCELNGNIKMKCLNENINGLAELIASCSTRHDILHSIHT